MQVHPSAEGAKSDFAVVPVIDLKGGKVVHARAGKRADYQPLKTPLAASDDPIDIARAVMVNTLSPVLYVADLDAIEGTGNHFELCRELGDALPGASLWIDAGFGDVSDCAFWLPLGATLVIGSESLDDLESWHELRATFGKSLVLSLDFDLDALRGPEALLWEAGLWPDRVIVLTLGRIGTNAGPDMQSLRAIRQRAAACAIYVGGGVRAIDDLEALAEAGARGALLATALHSRAVTQNEIAAFLRRRRSQT
jgi:phosphoribosylformimino-5-aminoimidazole carboxamide ribotide isomerase